MLHQAHKTYDYIDVESFDIGSQFVRRKFLVVGHVEVQIVQGSNWRRLDIIDLLS